jgi:hypothetical protein
MGDAKSVGESLGEDCADPAAAPLVGTRLPIALGGQLVGPLSTRHGWHAARRALLGTNLYRLGVPEKTIQAILRHANVSTTNTYYIKSAADDPRAAMAKLESLVIGNESAAETFVSDNGVTTDATDIPAAVIQ